MSDHASIAVAVPLAVEDEQATQRADAKPKPQPPYAVVVLI